jgi:mRNA interferase MazF
MRRGEIWWANLSSASGSGPGFRRPVLIVQSNAFNDSRISTVLVAVITSNLAIEQAPGNIRLNKSQASLKRSSVINVSRILTVDREILHKRISRLPAKVMERVNQGLKLVLGL